MFSVTFKSWCFWQKSSYLGQDMPGLGSNPPEMPGWGLHVAPISLNQLYDKCKVGVHLGECITIAMKGEMCNLKPYK